MTHVELVMEISGSLSEVSLNFSVELESGFNDWSNFSLNSCLKFGEMLDQISRVNSGQG